VARGSVGVFGEVLVLRSIAHVRSTDTDRCTQLACTCTSNTRWSTARSYVLFTSYFEAICYVIGLFLLDLAVLGCDRYEASDYLLARDRSPR
jgi:hypothetical protein